MKIIYGDPQRDKADEIAQTMREARALIDATCSVRLDKIGAIAASGGSCKRLNCRNCGAPWEPRECSYCRSVTP